MNYPEEDALQAIAAAAAIDPDSDGDGAVLLGSFNDEPVDRELPEINEVRVVELAESIPVAKATKRKRK